jgi:hypothetical protein
MGENNMIQEAVPKLHNAPLTGGIFDLNIILNFGKQWPEMKDFAYETRTLLLDTLYNVEHIGALVLGFIVGVLLASVIFIAVTRRKQITTALLLGLLFPVAGYAQPYEPQVDLVTIPYVDKNFGSKIDGSGMCVFNSFRASLVSQYRDDFDDYARWLAANYQGGGYPSRVAEYTKAYCRAKGIQDFDSQYVQVVGEDTIQAIEDALADGRSAAITYSGDPSFYGGPVPHMVNCVYLDQEWMGIVDNNRPDRVEWVDRATGIKRHRHYDAGWAIVYLGKPQLARPVNRPIDPPNRDRDPFRRVLFQGGNCVNGNCPPQFQPTQQSTGGHTWHDQGNGVWYLYRGGNVRVGEFHESDGRYYTYREGGALSPTELQFEAPTKGKTGKGKTPTGVLYGGFPELRRGQTLYGFGSNPIADTSNRLLYQDRVRTDRNRPRVVVNGSAELEARVRSLLKTLKSDAFVYGREAFEVIKQLGYGTGVTVLQGAKNGVAVEVNFFRDEPSDVQLRDALMRADPSYRPGGGVADAADSVLLLLAAVLAVLVGVYFYNHYKGEQK